MHQLIWLAMGYNAPAQPSKNRVYVWRKLREYGAGYFRPGVAILPKDAANLARLQTLAAKIREMGGDAVIAELTFCDERDEIETIQRFKKSVQREYDDIMSDSRKLSSLSPTQRDELLKKLVKRYVKAKSRDFFKAGDNVARGIIDLADDMERVAAGLGRQLLRMLEL